MKGVPNAGIGLVPEGTEGVQWGRVIKTSQCLSSGYSRTYSHCLVLTSALWLVASFASSFHFIARG